ncbi:Tetratricopeptide repeat-domain-containing protein [Pavlovales sp. CCMP2436]|nr:Tetratricopeptide repeat-domain-containing protein [Pavlovales sp. CCMP2436]
MLPEIAAEYRELGGHAWHNGDTGKAQAYYEKALNAFLKCLGKDHPEVACSMGDLANVYCDLGRFEDALEMYQVRLCSTGRSANSKSATTTYCFIKNKKN